MTQRKRQPPLAGIKVIELQGILAAASAAAFLADMGADVVKVEPPSGDILRPLRGAFIGINRGKRGVVIDIHKKEGQEVIYEWVKDGDIVIQNFRLGSDKKLGIDYDTLKRINPRLIYCCITPYGQYGPLRETPGWDGVLQGYSGLCATLAGNGEPAYTRYALIDITTGMLATLGVLSALVNRARSGKGQMVHTSLLSAALYTQMSYFPPYLRKIQQRGVAREWGRSAMHRIYRTCDGYIFVDADDDQSYRSLCAALRRDDLLEKRQFRTGKSRAYFSTSLSKILEDIFRRRNSRELIELFIKSGVPAAIVNTPDEVFAQPQVISNNLTTQQLTNDLGYIKHVGLVIKFLRTPGLLQRGAPDLGEHTDEILRELGYKHNEIEELRRKKVVA